MLDAFLTGAFLSLGLIIPLGMQNIFIFNQGASQSSLLKALPTVITAFLADIVLVMGAIYSVSWLALKLPLFKSIIYFFGLFFLLYIGWQLWKSAASDKLEPSPLSVKEQILFALSASFLNPHALVDTVAVIGPSSLNFEGLEKIVYTTACLSVSLFWFFFLCVAGRCLKQLDQSGRWLRAMNRLSALILWGIALSFVWRLVFAAS